MVVRTLTLAALTALAARPLAAGNEKQVYPLDPPDGAVVNSRPVFQLAYEGIDSGALRASRFRIALSSDGFRNESLIFDQREAATGWAHAEPGKVLYYPRHPVPDGEYQWKVWRWDGVGWIEGRRSFSLRVDSVAPADVEGLRIEYDHARGRYDLKWKPVTLDRNGDPEYVARYHVYRYDKGPPFPAVSLLEIGVSEIPELTLDEDRAERAASAPLLFYRVVAEDEAGNQAGRHR